MIARSLYSWTQPICFPCYSDRHPGRPATRLREPEVETCVDCGRSTTDGIYLRVDPAIARHPTRKRDDS